MQTLNTVSVSSPRFQFRCLLVCPFPTWLAVQPITKQRADDVQLLIVVWSSKLHGVHLISTLKFKRDQLDLKLTTTRPV